MTRGAVVEKRVAPSIVTDIEAFGVYAFCEIEAVRDASAVAGGDRLCEFPDCGLSFVPRLLGQVYCTPKCKGHDTAERRTVGLKESPALLAHRVNKYAKPETAEAALCRAARRYLTRLQSEWFESRNARRELALLRVQPDET